MSKTIVYEQDGKVILSTYADPDAVIDFPHIDYTGIPLPSEPIESWIIEDGELKIDQVALTLFLRERLPPLSRRQFNQAVRKFGLRAQIDAAVASIEDNDKREEIEIDLADSDTFERMSASILLMADLLDMTAEEIDDMWNVALTL